MSLGNLNGKETLVGFDISYHPVDVAFIQQRLLSYVMGEGSIDEAAETAARLAAIRFRANAWGLGALKACRPPRDTERPQKKPGLFSRLFGKPAAIAPETPAPSPPCEFEADLYVWGRPFFITRHDAEEVSGAINLYLEATPDTVDSIAREMLKTLAPALVDTVEPDMTGTAPDDELVKEDIRNQLDQLRGAYAALETGRKIPTPDGQEVSPEDFLAQFVPLTILSLASQFRPGWMARGHVWPTEMLSKADLDSREFFEPAHAIFQPLIERVPNVTRFLEPTITSNYTLGGFVPADRVTPLRQFLQHNREQILAPTVKDDWGDYGSLCLGKILEALHDAERRKIAFIEASEVYSGPMGIIN